MKARFIVGTYDVSEETGMTRRGGCIYFDTDLDLVPTLGCKLTFQSPIVFHVKEVLIRVLENAMVIRLNESLSLETEVPFHLEQGWKDGNPRPVIVDEYPSYSEESWDEVERVD